LTTAPTGLSRAAMTLIVAFGLLHVGSLFVAADGPVNGFLVGLLAASALPYLLCLAVLKWARNVGAALGGLLAIALFDAWMYWSVFIAPRGSTAAVGLVFAPLWKTFILLPIGAFSGRIIEAWLARRAAR
jgi:hypothetical protein